MTINHRNAANRTYDAAPPAMHPATLAVYLTSKEQEVMQWAAKGKSAWEIARIQGRSEAAVNFHLCNIRRKFGVHSMRAALVIAIDQGIIASH